MTTILQQASPRLNRTPINKRNKNSSEYFCADHPQYVLNAMVLPCHKKTYIVGKKTHNLLASNDTSRSHLGGSIDHNKAVKSHNHELCCTKLYDFTPFEFPLPEYMINFMKCEVMKSPADFHMLLLHFNF